MKWKSVEALAAYPGHFMVLTIIVFGYKFQARLSWQHSRCGADHTLLYPNSQLQAEQSWQQTSTTPACAVLPVEWVWIVQCVTKKMMPSFRMLFQNYVCRTVMLQIGRCPQKNFEFFLGFPEQRLSLEHLLWWRFGTVVEEVWKPRCHFLKTCTEQVILAGHATYSCQLPHKLWVFLQVDFRDDYDHRLPIWRGLLIVCLFSSFKTCYLSRLVLVKGEGGLWNEST